ncbi:MAG: peptidoglycan-binding domain-containing protein [bacterium]
MPQLAAATLCVALTHALYFGVTDVRTNGEVLKLQVTLGVMPSGYFGPLTKAAVQRWQVAHNLAAPGMVGYGVVGPKTRATLSCVDTPPTSPTVVSTTSATTTISTTATTSPFVATVASLFERTALLGSVASSTAALGVSQATKDLLIGVIVAEQKIYASNDASVLRAFLISSTADEPKLSNGYATTTDEQILVFAPLMHQIAAGIPSEAALRAPTTGWQVADTNATIQVGGTTVTLKKINGVWY